MRCKNKHDFHIPFEWEDRRPVIIENLLYIPNHYDKHHHFENKSYFENANPINIEYCSGNGQWIIERAKQNPGTNYIAVEMKFDRARQIWVKMRNENLKNLFVVMGEALIFTKHYLNSGDICDIFINFPDPWPKKKHEKNRLVSEQFLLQAGRVMKKNKFITLVTDDLNYLNKIIELFLKNENFKPVCPKPYYIQNIENFGSSFFDELFRKKNKVINYLKFEKN